MRVASTAQDDTRKTAVGRIKGSDQWAGGDDNRDLANERARKPDAVQRALFAFAVLAFIVLWIAASMT